MADPAHISAPPIASRTPSGGFKTSEGTLYVSKPYRSKSSKKLRALITFAPRKSHFDIENESSKSNEFRGFFSLFWISIFIFAVQSYVRSIEASGRPLNLGFATLFSQDAITLALSDAALVLSTGICVPFAISIKNGWIRYYWTGVILQHLIQTTILLSAITWTFNRKWPWVQSGFLTLHSLVMIMKMHSYMSVNGHLQQVTLQAENVLHDLHEASQAPSIGGWDKALLDAKSHRAETDALTAISTSSNGTREPTPSRTPDVPDGLSTSYTDAATATALRRRLATVSSTTNDTIVIEGNENESQSPTPPNGTAAQLQVDTNNCHPFDPHPLVDHPDARIADLATEYSELQSELTSLGPHYLTWPNNISLKNFAVYQLYPTLVYELEYPRTDRIRPIYLFEKTVATFGTFALLYTVTETFILPYIPTFEQSIARSLLDLALPFMIAYLLLFYIIFECICNAFAELSYFADRQFYDDWWNSTSWDEFSRKWNKPVHAFLLRHVYAPTIMGYGLSRTWAMFLTFLLSACVHELVMVIVTQKFRMYLFILQIVQIPMIVISRIPMVKRNKLLGNVVFWLGLYAGFPLLCVAYVTY
ncbi:MBOAT, membrane-bound O-acyltransferase family-domain-containing protein [Collybia nuda]|uniref:O-acyltransferase n=1 Tax=Collybia nuda TaxID=64659 RepID=A0A9P6CH67_9AGAR|nr:MBOAT, membrane-bound O-acyltransferase family-domain-containing protein [Collybia nuda]